MSVVINEETEWRSYNGKKTKLKDLENGHLLNIIKYIKERSKTLNVDCRDDGALIFLENMARKRGLMKLEKEIPHRAKDGDGWVIWNDTWQAGYETPVVGSRKLDIDICKKCRKQLFNDFWSDEDEQFYKQGIVICHKERKKQTQENEIPEGCDYLLEQLVKIKNTIGVENVKND